MTEYDHTYRVGRCNSRATFKCQRRPSFAWPAASGLRLEDTRCPYCGRVLDRTSREAHYMRALSELEIVEARRVAIEYAEKRLEEDLQCLAAWEEEIEVNPEADPYFVSLRIESYEQAVKHARERVARLVKARAKEVIVR